MSDIPSDIIDTTMRIEGRSNVLAILVVGSTATHTDYEPYDDFDVAVFTRRPSQQRTHYEILTYPGGPHLMSLYFAQLGEVGPKSPSVLDQPEVRVLVGEADVVRRIFIERPRRIEGAPSEIPDFAAARDRGWELVIDCAFILTRYERRGWLGRRKARLAREAIKTISKAFYDLYGKEFRRGQRPRWRSLLGDLIGLLAEEDFASSCANPKLFADFQSMAPVL